MAADRASEYRQKADECLRNAEGATSEDDKAKWLNMATQWQLLAQGREMRGRAAGPPTGEPKK